VKSVFSCCSASAPRSCFLRALLSPAKPSLLLPLSRSVRFCWFFNTSSCFFLQVLHTPHLCSDLNVDRPPLPVNSSPLYYLSNSRWSFEPKLSVQASYFSLPLLAWSTTFPPELWAVILFLTTQQLPLLWLSCFSIILALSIAG